MSNQLLEEPDDTEETPRNRVVSLISSSRIRHQRSVQALPFSAVNKEDFL